MTPYQFDPETRLAWMVVDRQAEALHERISWRWLHALWAGLLRPFRLPPKETEDVPDGTEGMEPSPIASLAADTGRIIMLDRSRPVEHRCP